MVQSGTDRLFGGWLIQAGSWTATTVVSRDVTRAYTSALTMDELHLGHAGGSLLPFMHNRALSVQACKRALYSRVSQPWLWGGFVCGKAAMLMVDERLGCDVSHTQRGASWSLFCRGAMACGVGWQGRWSMKSYLMSMRGTLTSYLLPCASCACVRWVCYEPGRDVLRQANAPIVLA